MNSLVNRKAIAVAVAASMVGVGALVAACSSSSNNGTGNNGADGSTGTTSADGGTPGSCANSTVQIIFSPMYSAYIPNSTAQTFKIPAVTADGNTATWSLSDPSQADLQPQSFTVDGVSQPGVMIQIAGIGAGGSTTMAETTGTVTVIATESDGSCGSAVLTITQNTENDWTVGSQRYNNGNNLHVGEPTRPDGGFPEGGFTRPEAGAGGTGGMGFSETDGGSFFETDGGTACTSCHGDQPEQPIFKDVQHTPEQTGGFSDDDLKAIILTGTVPDGGYFDPSVLDGFTHQTCDDAGTTVGPNMTACAQKAYTAWQGIHRWTDISTDEMPGVICYLRALAPAAQTGNSNFGGGGGGHRDGGVGHRDGGGFGGQDSGGGMTSEDSGSSTSNDAGLGAD